MAHALRRLLRSLGSPGERLEAAALVLQRACATPPQAATLLAAALDALKLSTDAGELAARLAQLAGRTPPQWLGELRRAALRFAAGDAARGAAVAAVFPPSAEGAG
jgi:hypothetical protein